MISAILQTFWFSGMRAWSPPTILLTRISWKLLRFVSRALSSPELYDSKINSLLWNLHEDRSVLVLIILIPNQLIFPHFHISQKKVYISNEKTSILCSPNRRPFHINILKIEENKELITISSWFPRWGGIFTRNISLLRFLKATATGPLSIFCFPWIHTLLISCTRLLMSSDL